MSPIKSSISELSGSSVSKVGIGSTVTIAGIAATSTGSIFNPGNGYRYHIFTQPGNLFVTSAGYVDYMVVGGGAGGGVGAAGPTPQPDLFKGAGGGGGGVVQSYLQLFPTGTYTINVGTGGRSSTGDGFPGNPSFIISPGISSITAFGGFGGGGGPAIGGTCGFPQFYAGGSRQSYPIPAGQGSGGGGGGGAGGQGNPSWGSPNPGAGGQGGDGISAFNADPGVPSAYGYPLPSAGRFFAGGGGGGGPGGGGPAPTGGSGGSTPIPGTDANTNTGGGGGGAAYGRIAGSGGSGIIIIRYKLTVN